METVKIKKVIEIAKQCDRVASEDQWEGYFNADSPQADINVAV